MTSRFLPASILLACLLCGVTWFALANDIFVGSLGVLKQWERDFGAEYKVAEDGEIAELTIRSAAYSDEDAQRLVEHKHLEVLNLSGTSITKATLTIVNQLPALRVLKLDDTQVAISDVLSQLDNVQLHELSMMRCVSGESADIRSSSFAQLQTLNLMGSGVDDSVIRRLGTLENLEHLYLGNTLVTTDVLPVLAECRNLRLLNLNEMHVAADASLAVLGQLPGLELLYLDYSEIQDVHLKEFIKAAIANESKLSALFLEGCEITDASVGSLQALVQMPQFSKLRLTGTQVSRTAFEQIVNTSPDVSYAHGTSSIADD